MADYNISGLVPAFTGDSWGNFSSWFLLDQSGTFSVDRDLTCTIYLVGGGYNGNISNFKERNYVQGGKGGDGGCVYTAQHVTIPKNTDCSITIAEINDKIGTNLNISGNVLSCNDVGCISTTGGSGSYSYWRDNRVGYVRLNGSVRGTDGINTPYGYVGSSGGGGGSNVSNAEENGADSGNGAGRGGFYYGSAYGGSANNYGCGGGGSGAVSYDNNNAGSGKGGCVIICVTDGYYPLPYLETTEFEYNGKEQRADGDNLKNFDSNVMEVSGTVSGTYASSNEDDGTYKLRVSFKLGCNFNWVDENGNAIDYIELPWKIKPIEVPVPTLSFTSVPYEGRNCNKTVTISEFNPNDSDIMTKTGVETAYKAGKYPIVFSLKDAESSVWVKEDGTKTTDDIVVTWQITPITVERPYIVQNEFTYKGYYYYPFNNGQPPYDNFSNYNSKVMYEESEGCVYVAYQANADGEYYTAKYTLYDHESCAWSDSAVTLDEETGTWADNTDLTTTIKWRINKRVDKIPMPYLSPTDTDVDGNNVTEFTYTGWSLSPTINNRYETYATYGGDFNAIKVGDWKITAILKTDPNIIWRWDDGTEDGSDKNVELKWKINRAKLSKAKLPYLDENIIYNAREQTPPWRDYDIRKLTIGGVNSATNVGTYTVTFTPTANYIWDDGTLDPVSVSWAIEKLGIMIPRQNNTLYYNGKTQTPNWTISYNLKNITYTGQTSGVEVNEYAVLCKCDSNCYFIDTGTDTCTATWKIRKCRLRAPYPEKRYPYTGDEITPVFLRYHPDIMGISGKTSAVNKGKYTAYFKLTETDNYMWAVGVHLTEDELVSVDWYIINSYNGNSSTRVSVPYQNNYSVYNKGSQSPTFANYSKDIMTLLGDIPTRTNAGTYRVTFRLKDGYMWSDGTTGDKTIEWRIEPQKVSFPYALTDGTGAYYYEINGKRYPIWGNYDPDLMRMSGDIYGEGSTWSTTYFELKDKKNYVWERSGDSSDEDSVTWKPTKAYTKTPTTGCRNKVHIPRQANRPIEDGTTKYPKWDRYDNTAIINLGGEWEGITAGERYVILMLHDGYIWEDDTDEIKAVPWKIYESGTSESDIEPIPIRIPKQINPPYYDGYVKEPEWDSWDDYGFDVVDGTLMEVPAGEYRIKLRLKTGYIWEDGTTEDKIVTWIINPRDIEEIPDADIPRDPAPERDENEDGVGDGNGNGGNGTGNGCGCCCCDTGLYDILKNACPEDDEHCDCT